MRNTNCVAESLRATGQARNIEPVRYTRTAMIIFVLVLLLGPSVLYAQTPDVPIAGHMGDSQGGFRRGLSAGIRFEGSASDYGSIYDLSSSVGYNFTHHFGVDLGVPYYFIGTPTSIRTQNTLAVSGTGIGDLAINFKGDLPSFVNYGPTFRLGVPTGDTNKGLGTGHVTWNVNNHFYRSFKLFTPFIDAGVGNTILQRWQFSRPFTVFGQSAQFEAGTGVDLGPFSFSGSAYDVLPWGDQTVISRVFRCPKNTKCTPDLTTNRLEFLLSSVARGAASLVRDNGFNSSVEVHPLRQFDLEFAYSHSMPLQLDSFSFGIGVDLISLMHPAHHSGTR